MAETMEETCSGSCYSEFEEGRACSRHGREAPTVSDVAALENGGKVLDLMEALAAALAPEKGAKRG